MRMKIIASIFFHPSYNEKKDTHTHVVLQLHRDRGACQRVVPTTPSLICRTRACISLSVGVNDRRAYIHRLYYSKTTEIRGCKAKVSVKRRPAPARAPRDGIAIQSSERERETEARERLVVPPHSIRRLGNPSVRRRR